VDAREQLSKLLEAVAPHAADLGCEAELKPIPEMAKHTGARRQLDFARQGNGLRGLVEELAERFCSEGYADPDVAPSTFAPAWAGRSG
jgi:gamma-glutamyl:cysteine ligase YbdK (ATP-grasp superfamily)